MKEIRATVTLVMGILLLALLAACAMVNSNPADKLCLRFIVRLPVPPDWRETAHRMAPESTLCLSAEAVAKERAHEY